MEFSVPTCLTQPLLECALQKRVGQYRPVKTEHKEVKKRERMRKVGENEEGKPKGKNTETRKEKGTQRDRKSLTHGAEPFLKSRQMCSHTGTSQHFKELEG
jgi:hypothetical protein